MKITLATLATSFAVGAAGCAPAADDPLFEETTRDESQALVLAFPAFAGWGGAVTAFGDHLRAIAILRVETARAELLRAQAAQEWAKAAILRALLLDLERDLALVQRQARDRLQLISRIDRKARDLNPIVMGRVTPLALAALRYFVPLIAGDLDLLFDDTIEPLGVEEFKLRTNVRTLYDRATHTLVQVPVVLEPFPGGNVMAFLAWLGENPVDLVPGSRAHETLMRVASELGRASEAWRLRLQAELAEIRGDRSRIWASFAGPSGFGSLPPRRLNP